MDAEITQAVLGWDENGAEVSTLVGQTETVYDGAHEYRGKLASLWQEDDGWHGTVEFSLGRNTAWGTGWLVKQERVAMTYEAGIEALAHQMGDEFQAEL